MSILPPGWKVIEAKTEGSESCETIILNPKGKRFYTLEEANEELEAQEVIKMIFGEAEDDIKKSFEKKTKVENMDMTESAKRRRKQKAMRSPFRNLLKITLKRQQKEKFKGM